MYMIYPNYSAIPTDADIGLLVYRDSNMPPGRSLGRKPKAHRVSTGSNGLEDHLRRGLSGENRS